MNELISVIIPVYNVQKYVARCIKSVLRQTYQNLEIIIIDDGSTDESGEICDKFSNYAGIKVFHKKNGGLSDARNYGIVHSKGEFLSFIDSDDVLHPCFFERLYNAIKKYEADIAACNVKLFYQESELDYLEKNTEEVIYYSHSDALKDDLDENVDGITHLFNAMRGLHHRDETLVNCAFEGLYPVELIGDGRHVAENVLKLAIRNIDKDKIILITDSSPARSMPDGEYEFISMRCIKKEDTFITEDGHFAGSVVSIPEELKVLHKLGAKYTDLLLYASLNPFRFYGLDKRFGTIEKGKYADLVIMDDDFNVKDVYIGGRSIHV